MLEAHVPVWRRLGEEDGRGPRYLELGSVTVGVQGKRSQGAQENAWESERRKRVKGAFGSKSHHIINNTAFDKLEDQNLSDLKVHGAFFCIFFLESIRMYCMRPCRVTMIVLVEH